MRNGTGVVQNKPRQPIHGFCNKIENYLSELGKWRVWRTIIIGQFLSLVLCFETLVSRYINTMYRFLLPTGQNLPHYIMLCLVYTPWMYCRLEKGGLKKLIKDRGLMYLRIAFLDVEVCTFITLSNQMIGTGYIQLFDCIAIPLTLLFSRFWLGLKFRIEHIVGVSVCLIGVGCLFLAKIDDRKSFRGKDNDFGEVLCFISVALFSTITVNQEVIVKKNNSMEYLGMIGFLGTILCCFQSAVFDHQKLKSLLWYNKPVITFLTIKCVTQFVFFSLVPVILYESGATALQLALITENCFNILYGILIHRNKFHIFYFVAYMLIMTGIFIYAIKRTSLPVNMRRSRVKRRNERVVSLKHKICLDVKEVVLTTSSRTGENSTSDTLNSESSTKQELQQEGNNKRDENSVECQL